MEELKENTDNFALEKYVSQGVVNVDAYILHANLLYKRFYSIFEKNTPGAHLSRLVADRDKDIQKNLRSFILLVLQCSIENKIEFTSITDIKECRGMLRKYSGLEDLQKYLQEVKSNLQREKLILLSKVKYSVKRLWEYPESYDRIEYKDNHFSNMKEIVNDITMWVKIVRHLCEFGNEILMKKFMQEKVEFSKRHLKKDKVLSAFIISSIIGEVKEVLDIDDIKLILNKVRDNPKWSDDIENQIHNLLGNSFSEINFSSMISFKELIHYLNTTYIPSFLLGRTDISKAIHTQIKNLVNAYNLAFQVSVRSKVGSTDTMSYIKISEDMNVLVERQSCEIFLRMYNTDPMLLLHLNETQIYRLLSFIRLHNVLDENEVKSIFIKSHRKADFEKVFATLNEIKDYSSFVGFLSMQRNLSILKDVNNFKNDKVEIQAGINGNVFIHSDQVTGILKQLTTLMAMGMKEKDYYNLILNIYSEYNSLLEPDDELMYFLFFYNKLKKKKNLPKKVLDFVKKQIWYELFMDDINLILR